MRRVIITNPTTGSKLELRFDPQGAGGENPVMLYQNNAYAGVHTVAAADKAIANARAKGMPVEDITD